MYINKTLEKLSLSHDIEKIFEWDKWRKEIPYIKFPPEWKIKIIPPFVRAIIRYRVTKEGLNGSVSVYLDCYDILGYVGEPYWEIYPNENDDISRYKMNDIDGLLNGIEISLYHMENNKTVNNETD